MPSPMQEDLTRIKASLDADLATIADQITETEQTILTHQTTLKDLATSTDTNAEQLAQVQTTIAIHTRTLAAQRTRAEHARGTSLEETTRTACEKAETDLHSAETEADRLQQAQTAIKTQQAQTTGQLVETQMHLIVLQEQQANLRDTRAQFDMQHASVARDEALPAVQKANETIAELETQLEAAKATRTQAQADLARALVPWPDMARDTLLATCTFEEHPAVHALTLKKQLVDILEHAPSDPLVIEAAPVLNTAIPVQDILNYGGRPNYPTFRQSRMGINPFLTHLDEDMKTLDQAHATLQQKHHAAQVRALMHDAQQPTEETH